MAVFNLHCVGRNVPGMSLRKESGFINQGLMSLWICGLWGGRSFVFVFNFSHSSWGILKTIKLDVNDPCVQSQSHVGSVFWEGHGVLSLMPVGCSWGLRGCGFVAAQALGSADGKEICTYGMIVILAQMLQKTGKKHLNSHFPNFSYFYV